VAIDQGWRDNPKVIEREARYYKREFWSEENLKYSPPHFRLVKSAMLINELAGKAECNLLDVGCGPATLASLLSPNVHYYGIDIAIQHAAGNLLEVDILERPIKFGDQKFDVVVAQGLFEYLGQHQRAKLFDISQVLEPTGTFLTSYVNFDHRRPNFYSPYSNIVPISEFRRDLNEHFVIERILPTSHNWRHNEPNRRVIRSINMHLNVRVPLITSKLAVEFFFICSPRST
jgi:SAM-dependent methyltransferase